MAFLNFKDRPFNTNRSAFPVLLYIVEIELMKLEEERAQQRNSIAPPKSDVAGDNKTLVGDDEASKKTEANPVGKITEQLPGVDFEFMSSSIQETLRKANIKKGKKPISSSPVTKCKTYMEEEDDIDQVWEFDEEQRNVDEEWVPVPQKPPKKKRKNLNNASGDGIKRKNPFKQQPTQCADPPPDLPEEFKNKIGELGGTEVTLLIQKTLFKTDLSKQHNRLSMPLKQIKKPDFLLECEIQQLKEGLKVPLIHQPSRQVTDIIFCKWDMEKKRGDPSSCYILRHRWIEVVDKNQLTERDVIQVWSFRVEGRLCMALVKL